MKRIFKKISENIWLFIRTVDSKDIIGIIISSITIVAFLFVAKFFTARSSLNVEVAPESRRAYYYMDTVKALYEEYGIELPAPFRNDENINYLFKGDRYPRPNGYVDPVGSTDLDLIKAILSGQEVSHLEHFRTDKLENRMGNYSYNKYVYFLHDNRSFCFEEDIKRTCEYIKNVLSDKDYYIFLAFLIYSRELQNTINIRNDGNVNLKNVLVTVPSPLSRVSENRLNNILKFTVTGIILHEPINNANESTIRIPHLRVDDFVSLHIVSRENMIKEAEIIYTYESEKVITKGKIVKYSVIIVLFTLMLKITFRRRELGASYGLR